MIPRGVAIQKLPKRGHRSSDFVPQNRVHKKFGVTAASQMCGLRNMKNRFTLLWILAGILVLCSIPVESVLGQNPDSLSSPKPKASVGWGMGTHGVPRHVIWSGFYLRNSFPRSQLTIGYSWLLLAPGGERPAIWGQFRRMTETKRQLAGRPLSQYIGLNAAIVRRMYIVGHDHNRAFLYTYDSDKPHFSASESVSGPEPIVILGFEYGYNWPVHKAGRLTINANVGASANVTLVGFFPYTALFGYLGLAYLSVDAALTMDLFIGGR